MTHWVGSALCAVWASPRALNSALPIVITAIKAIALMAVITIGSSGRAGGWESVCRQTGRERQTDG